MIVSRIVILLFCQLLLSAPLLAAGVGEIVGAFEGPLIAPDRMTIVSLLIGDQLLVSPSETKAGQKH